jgi:hypothetical protein
LDDSIVDTLVSDGYRGHNPGSGWRTMILRCLLNLLESGDGRNSVFFIRKKSVDERFFANIVQK